MNTCSTDATGDADMASSPSLRELASNIQGISYDHHKVNHSLQQGLWPYKQSITTDVRDTEWLV